MPDTVKGVEIDPVKEKLVELLSRYFTIGDSYAYNLTRVKEAFAVGTVSLDDFVEFDEEVVADIVDFLIANGVTLQELNGCEYCNDGKTIETDIDGEIEIVKIIPLPAIDLVTGEQERKAASPYWAMRLLLDGGEDFVRIHFCPLCGRRLPQPPNEECDTLIRWVYDKSKQEGEKA